MKQYVEVDAMIQYLQELLDDFMEEKEEYGIDCQMVVKHYNQMIACAEMVKSLINQPVNLQKDGKVTYGF